MMSFLCDDDGANKNRRSVLLYSEADFDNIISAFDQTMNENFGHIAKNSAAIDTKNRESNEDGSVEAKNEQLLGYSSNVLNINQKFSDSKRPRSGVYGMDAQHHPQSSNKKSMFVQQISSTSVPQNLHRIRSKGRVESRTHPLPEPLVKAPKPPSELTRQTSKEIPTLAKNGWKTQSNLTLVEITEVEIDPDSVAIGVLNSRKLPIVPTSPRFVRMCNFFSKLKNGLNEWIDLQTTLLQQAELDQDAESESKVADSLNKFKQRLNVILHLEQDYMRYYKIYRELRSTVHERQSHNFSNPRISMVSGLSKSALVLNYNEDSNSSECLKTGWGSSLLNTSVIPKEKHISMQATPSDSGIHLKPDSSAGSSPLSSEHHYKRPKSRSGRLRGRQGKPDLLSENNARRRDYVKHQLCQIEAQTEYLSGTFKVEIIGISGCHRYFNKDEFKMSFNHGPPTLPTLYELHHGNAKLVPINKATIEMNEKFTVEDKWQSHGRVHAVHSIGKKLRSNERSGEESGSQTDIEFPQQIWDNPAYIFSPAIDSVLTLKAKEFRRFGRDELLQHQAFDLNGLLSAKGYQLSTSLKHGGRVRFHLLIHWSPIADTDDVNLVYYNPSLLQVNKSEFSKKARSLGLSDLDTGRYSQPESQTDQPSPSNQTSLESVSLDSCFHEGHTRSCTCCTTQPTGLEDTRTRVIITRPPAVTILSAKPEKASHVLYRKIDARMQCISMPDLPKAVNRKEAPNGVKAITIKSNLLSETRHLDASSDFEEADSILSQGNSVEKKLTRFSVEDPKNNMIKKFELALQKASLMEKSSPTFLKLLCNLKSHLNQLLHAYEDTTVRTPKANTAQQSTGWDVYTSDLDKKGDTLTELWDTFAFLDDPTDSKQEKILATSESSVISTQSACSDLITQPLPTCGPQQLEQTIDWHLDYIVRLLDKLSPGESSRDPSILRNLGCSSQLNLLGDSVQVYTAAVALLGQVSVLEDLIELTKKNRAQNFEALTSYITQNLLGGEIQTTQTSRLFYELFGIPIPPNKELPNHLEPKMVLEVRPLQQTLMKFYKVRVYLKWPEVGAKLVIDALLEDLLDVPVNGENMMTITVTHLNQRLSCSQYLPQHSTWAVRHPNRRMIPIEKRLYQVLCYLSGQQYIQDQLATPAAFQMLSSLPHFKRSNQSLFDVWRFRKSRSTDGLSTRVDQCDSIECRQLPVSACLSTRTWLVVASLVQGKDKHAAARARTVICDFDREVKEVVSQLRCRQEYWTHNGSVCISELPILIAFGPPLHLTMTILDLISQTHSSPTYLPPLWISMCLGLGPYMDPEWRVAGLHGLSLVLQQSRDLTHIRVRLRTSPFVKNEHEIREQGIYAAVLRYLQYISEHDTNKTIRIMADRILNSMKTPSPSNAVPRTRATTRPTLSSKCLSESSNR